FLASPLGGEAAPAPALRVALGGDLGSLDTPLLADGTHLPLALALADFLVTTDPSTGFGVPGLADSWVTSADRKTWTFSLKPARWSDGQALTAQDVADSWVRGSAAPDPVGNVLVDQSAPDPRHLKVTFRDPVPSAAVFACWRFAVVGDLDVRTAGPFRIDSRVPGRSLTVTKNPRYREAASVRFDKVTFIFTDSPGTAELLFRKGEVDWVPYGSGPGTAVDPGLRDAVTAPGWGTTFLRFNLTLVPGSDPGLRKVLSLALDRRALATNLRGPLSVPAASLIPGATGVETRKTKVLPVAGIPAFTILHPAGETPRRFALAVADQWSNRLGLTIDTKQSASADYLADRKQGLYQVALSGWLGDYPDPLTFLAAFRSDSADNDTGWSDPKFDALVDKIVQAPWGTDRTKLVAQAEGLLLGALPVVPLVHQASVNQINLKKWSGWFANPTDRHPWTGFGPKR
ncbi:MAG TPA: peptide ABC transporter substrate-binding protein, partial [Spirochaetia bacterium]|nr:peptide ABC transporter substrate-binding protein [Spirochaetia bacterium]